MPVVAHETVRKKCDGETFETCAENSNEGFVISGTLKKRRTFCAPVHYMKDQTCGGLTTTSGHCAVMNGNGRAGLDRATLLSLKNDSRPH